MARKPHPSSVLKTLPDDDQAALFEFLRDKTLAEGVQWLFSNNGVRTNDSSLSDWRSWYAMTQEIGAWNSDVEELKQLLRTDATIDPNLIPKIGEAVFISRAAKQGDAKTFAAVASIIQRHKELEANQAAHGDKMKLGRDKLDLQNRDLARKNKELEIKVAEFEKQKHAAEVALNKAKGNGGMTEETVKVIRQALGMSPDP